MALPEQLQVRISSEAAGAISITPVVVEVMPLEELMWIVLSAAGKDAGRVRDVLARGMVVQGASRFRWAGLPATSEDVDKLLCGFPDDDPSRLFRRDRCIGVRIRAGQKVTELPCEIAARRRLLRRRSFWDALMDLAARSKLDYIAYSYRTRTDDYRLRLSPSEVAELRIAAGLLQHSGLTARLRADALESVEFAVRFP